MSSPHTYPFLAGAGSLGVRPQGGGPCCFGGCCCCGGCGCGGCGCCGCGCGCCDVFPCVPFRSVRNVLKFKESPSRNFCCVNGPSCCQF